MHRNVTALQVVCGLLCACCVCLGAASDADPAPGEPPAGSAESLTAQREGTAVPTPAGPVAGAELASAESATANTGARTDAIPWLDVPLVDQAGLPTRLGDYRGKLVVLSFVFTHCPGPCPALTARLADLQRRMDDALASQVHFVSVGIDPNDSLAALAEFARVRGVSFANWSFVSGEPADVERLAELFASGLFPGEGGRPDHRLTVFLLDREGRNVQRYAASDLDVPRMLREIAQLAGR